MSFRNSLFEAIETTINSYIEKIANEYGLDCTELHSLWNKTTSDTLPPVSKIAPVFRKSEIVAEKPSETSDGTTNMSKMTKNELVDLCKAKGFKVTGTKSDLIERLTSTSSSKEIVVVEKSREKIVHKEPEVIRHLSANIPTVPIRKNVFGNYEHAETSLLFDEKTRRVIGKQNEDGTVASLSKSDIDLCNKYKFQYEIPSNLNESKDKVTVTATGCDDEEEDDGSQINDDEFLEEEDEELSDEDYISDE